MSADLILSVVVGAGLILAAGTLAVYGVIEVLASRDRGGE